MTLSLTGLLSVVVWLIVVGGVFWLLLWAIGYLGIPEPFAKVARIVLVIVALVLCINLLLGLVGESFIRLR